MGKIIQLRLKKKGQIIFYLILSWKYRNFGNHIRSNEARTILKINRLRGS